jgi:hypothetical protein
MRRTLIGMQDLRFGGRPVSWFGVGAPDAVAPGIASLQAAVAQSSSSANPAGAVAALQAAGNAAVSAVGPAIDALSGGNPDVMKVTQQAWQQNGALASLNGGTQSDLDAATKIAQQMIAYYQQAAKLAASKAPPTKSGSAANSKSPASSSGLPATTPDASSSGLDPMTWVAIGCGAAALVVGGIIVATYRPVT